jgi:hypothetical protein
MPPPVIVQVADSIEFLEQPRVNRAQTEIVLSQPLQHIERAPSFHRADLTARVRNYRLSDVLLDSNTGLLVKDEQAIPETAYFMPPDPETRTRNAVALDDSADLIIASNAKHRDYLHWMTQCLPAIDWSLRQKRSRGVRLLLPKLAPWQEETLRILGCGDAPRFTLKPDTFYYLPHAEYSEYLNGSATFHVCLTIADTARRILERLPRDRPHGSDPVLFVPGSDPGYWPLANQEEIADLLRQRGVCIVGPELMFSERIDLFRDAQVVIGPSGPGLADIVFCGPGTLLWEWMPAENRNVCFNRLAQAGEMDYWGEIIESDTQPADPQKWVGDIAAIRNRLPALSERLARRNDTARPGHRPGRTIDALMGEFESLGDNCEFGLIQRNAEMEQLGLFRFAAIALDKLIEG